MTQPNQLPPVNFDPPKDNFRHPLIRFSGECTGHEVITNEPNAQYGRTKQSQSVKFYFKDITVIESHEPYVFPITDVTIPVSTAGDTRWAAFTGSVRSLVPADAYANLTDPLDALTGKVQEWHMKPAKLRAPMRDPETNEVIQDASGKDKWGIADADAWQIVSITGFAKAGVDLMDVITDALNGKTDKEFLDWLFTEQSLKSYPGFSDVVEAATDRKLIPQLVSMGRVSQGADGKYVKA